MKLSTFRTICFFLAISITLANANTKQDFDKIIEKEFPITANGDVDIVNKYGSINVTEWNKNAISIVVSINVKASSQSKADKIFDRIDIKFKNDPAYVMAHTEVNSSNFTWSSPWNSGSDYQINYEVKMPNSVKLKLANKYGNTYLPNLLNDVDLSVKYGKLRMQNVEGAVNIELAYAQAEFNTLVNAETDMKYSEFKGSKVADLHISSKYSEIDVDEAREIRSESSYDSYILGKVQSVKNSGKYDDFRIGEVGSISVESKYSDIEIDHLIGDLKLSQSFGNISVDQIDCSSGEIKMKLNYVDVSLDMDNCSDYEINIEGSYSDYDLQSNLKSKLTRDGKYSSLDTKSGNGNRRIELDMNYGSLKYKI